MATAILQLGAPALAEVPNLQAEEGEAEGQTRGEGAAGVLLLRAEAEVAAVACLPQVVEAAEGEEEVQVHQYLLAAAEGEVVEVHLLVVVAVVAAAVVPPTSGEVEVVAEEGAGEEEEEVPEPHWTKALHSQLMLYRPSFLPPRRLECL